jgi:GTP 3',8-cyclase
MARMDAPLPFDGHPGPTDTLGRALRDLRISVTDRCNFRCTYCMPKEIFGKDYAFLPRDQVLRFEEIARISRIFVSLGVTKLRITGGEPLVRRDLPVLIGMLAAIRRPDGGPLDLTLTTNGSGEVGVIASVSQPFCGDCTRARISAEG